MLPKIGMKTLHFDRLGYLAAQIELLSTPGGKTLT